MTRKKIIIIIIVILLIAGLGIGGYVYYRLQKQETHVKFEELKSVKIDNPKMIDNNEYAYQLTDEKELRKWGIDIDFKEVKKGKHDFLAYSFGYKLKDIWYNTYNPMTAFEDGTGGIWPEIKYEKDEPNVLHVYIVRDLDIGFDCFSQVK